MILLRAPGGNLTLMSYKRRYCKVSKFSDFVKDGKRDNKMRIIHFVHT